MTVRPDMEDLAQELGVREPLPRMVPLKLDVFACAKDAADAKGTTVAEIVDWALRQWFGMERER